jgi:hypothetical protein
MFLEPGSTVLETLGPAVVEQPESTTVLPPGTTAESTRGPISS